MFLMGLSVIGGLWKHARFILVNESGKLISRAKVQARLSQRLIPWKSEDF